MKQSRTQLKQWYKKGLKPLEGQFADWIDSYWHLDDTILPDLSGYEVKASKGLANGYASLDATGKVPLSQLPSLPSLGWNLTGNSGTNSTDNFIGTIDNVPLNFRVNNVVRATISSEGVTFTTPSGGQDYVIQNTSLTGGDTQTFTMTNSSFTGPNSVQQFNMYGRGSKFFNMGEAGSAGNRTFTMEGVGNKSLSIGSTDASSVTNTITLGSSLSGVSTLTLNGNTAAIINGLNGLNLGTNNTDRIVITSSGAVKIPTNVAPTIGQALTASATDGTLQWSTISSGAKFSKYVPTTVTNTTTETSLLGTGSGTATIAANELVLGKRYRVFFLTYTSSPNTTPRSVTTRLKIGGTIIYSNILNINTVLINSSQWFLGEFVCTATGLSGSIYSELINTVSPSTGTGTVNTTIANTVDVTAQWSDAVAGNTITCNSLSIIPLN